VRRQAPRREAGVGLLRPPDAAGGERHDPHNDNDALPAPGTDPALGHRRQRRYPAPTHPGSAVGWRVVVLDGHKPDLAAVLLDKFYCLPVEHNWTNSNYRTMYKSMITDILDPGQPGNVLIAASFGLDGNMLPTDDFVAVLRSAGAGSKLRYWLEHCTNPGSEIANGSFWVGSGVNYLIVGVFGAGWNTGAEIFNRRVV
jgi:hypothetical protein